MGIEKAGAYESSLGSIFGRCVKAFRGSVGENERQLKQSFPRIKNYSLQWGAAESVQDKIQITAKNSGTKKRGLSVALKKQHLNRVVTIGCGGIKRHASCCACDNFFVILFANSGEMITFAVFKLDFLKK